MKVIVDRKQWARGKSVGRVSYFLNPQTNKCDIMGFYLLSIGFSKEEIRGAGTFYNIKNKEALPDWCLDKNITSSLAWEIMFTNDGWTVDKTQDLLESEIERLLKEKFQKLDIELVFYN